MISVKQSIILQQVDFIIIILIYIYIYLLFNVYGFNINKKIINRLSDIVMVSKMTSKLFNIIIIQAYAPTSASSIDDI